MPNYFLDVLCYPTTFPIGMITNYVYQLDFCYDTDDRETKIKGEDSKVNIDQRKSSSNLISGTQLNMLNQEFNDIMLDNTQSTTIKQIVNQKIKTDCDFTGIEDNKLIDKVNSKGQPMYGCCPYFSQEAIEKIVVINEVNEDQKIEMVNKVKAKVTDNLKQQGRTDVDIKARVENMNKIQSTLISNIDSKVSQFISQQSVSDQEIVYKDNMGVCYDGAPRIMEQKSILESLSMNIITSSIDIIMKNDTKIKSTTDTTVTGISNWVILGSMIIDVICISVCFFIIKNVVFSDL